MAKKAIRNEKQKFKGSAGDDRNLVLVDDDFQDADFEDKVWLFWRRHGKKTIAIATLIFFAALAVIVYTQAKKMHVVSLQNDYAALKTDDERRAFARENTADPMAGTIFFALGNNLFREGKYAEAAEDYRAAATVFAALAGTEFAMPRDRAKLAEEDRLIHHMRFIFLVIIRNVDRDVLAALFAKFKEQCKAAVEALQNVKIPIIGYLGENDDARSLRDRLPGFTQGVRQAHILVGGDQVEPFIEQPGERRGNQAEHTRAEEIPSALFVIEHLALIFIHTAKGAVHLMCAPKTRGLIKKQLKGQRARRSHVVGKDHAPVHKFFIKIDEMAFLFRGLQHTCIDLKPGFTLRIHMYQPPITQTFFEKRDGSLHFPTITDCTSAL